MQKMRFKTKYIDVFVRYKESITHRHTKLWEDQLDGIITFRIQYPFISDTLLKEFSQKHQIEYIDDSMVYFASSPSVILPSRKGGNYQSTFVHPTYNDDITDNMRKYVNILSDLDKLITKAYEELNSGGVSF